jgi:hypothetical protein
VSRRDEQRVQDTLDTADQILDIAQVVHITYIHSKDGDYVHEIGVGREGRETEEIGVAGLPNGIFLPPCCTMRPGNAA